MSIFRKNKKQAKLNLAPANEPPAPLRPVAEIQVEYTNLCQKAGHIQYQIYTLERDLDSLNQTLRVLNFEAAQSKQAEDAAKAAEAQKPAETPSEEKSK